MRRTTARAMLAVSMLLLGACAQAAPPPREPLLIGGVSTKATGPKVEASAFSTAVGQFALLTYPTAAGPCYDLVLPDGRVEMSCLRASFVDPAEAVTGDPATGSLGLTAWSLDFGITHDGPIGWVHHGIAHPRAHEIRVEPADGAEALTFPVIEAPNQPGLRVFFVYSLRETGRHRLAAYDREGCLVDAMSETGPGLSPEQAQWEKAPPAC